MADQTGKVSPPEAHLAYADYKAFIHVFDATEIENAMKNEAMNGSITHSFSSSIKHGIIDTQLGNIDAAVFANGIPFLLIGGSNKSILIYYINKDLTSKTLRKISMPSGKLEDN